MLGICLRWHRLWTRIISVLSRLIFVTATRFIGCLKRNILMVVNFAAESHVDRSIENPAIFLETNIMGTAVLMDAYRKYGIQRYHQVSTDEAYGGDLPLDRPDLFFTETTPIHTSSPYSSSKASASSGISLSSDLWFAGDHQPLLQ